MGKKPIHRPPTIRDVARIAGVAPITVSRVINNTGYISEETRIRVETAIEELHYVPNTLSRSLRFKKTNTIALLVSDINNPFWPIVTRGVEDASQEHGLNVILCNTDENTEKLERYVTVLLQKQVDGFLLVPTGDDERIVRSIEKQQVPMVLLDRTLPNAAQDTVRSDSRQGAYDATRYLIELGHERITMISGPLNVSTGRDRLEGYQRAMQDADLDASLVHCGGWRQESGYQYTREILQRPGPRPTAIFAGNNVIASGVLRALVDHGLRVPDDISLLSFDDLPSWFAPKPFMTVIAQSPYELGQRAAQHLVQTITGAITPEARDIVLPVELIVRASCAQIKEQVK